MVIYAIVSLTSQLHRVNSVLQRGTNTSKLQQSVGFPGMVTFYGSVIIHEKIFVSIPHSQAFTSENKVFFREIIFRENP